MFEQPIPFRVDSSDVYLPKSIFPIEGFDAPYPDFITREGFIMYLGTVRKTHISLVDWYRYTLMPEAIDQIVVLRTDTGDINQQGFIIDFIKHNNHIYYKVNDVVRYCGLAKNSAIHRRNDLAQIGFKHKSKGATQPGWYVHRDGLYDILEASKSAKTKEKLNILFSPARLRELPESAYTQMKLIEDMHMIAREQIARSLCEMLKHFGSL